MKEKAKKKTRPGRLHFLLACGLVIYLFIMLADYSGWMDTYKFGWWDHLVTTYEKRPPNPKVILLTINNDDLEKVGDWPWDRRKLAGIIDFLKDAGAKVIAFDIYMRKEKPEEDKEFFRAISEHGKVIIAQAWDYNNDMPEDPPESFKKSGAYFGNVGITQKKLFRHMPLFIVNPIYDNSKSFAENLQPSLSLMAVKLFKDLEKEPLKHEKNTLRIGQFSIPLVASENDRHDIAYHMHINYSGGEGHLFRHDQSYPVSTIFVKNNDEDMQPIVEELKEKVRGKIVILLSAFDPNDQFKTPYTAKSGRDTEMKHLMPGGEIHAQSICTILDERFINQNGALGLVIPFIFLLAGVIIFSRPLSWKIRIALFAALCIIWPALSIIIFVKWRLLTNLYSPFMALILVFIALIYYERKQFLTYFGQFVSHKLKDDILKDERAAEVGTREVEATIVFADIRGFSTLSENLTPGELTTMITEYHTEMNKVFERNRGVILDYLGDAEMVGFGTLCEERHHALLAINAGLEMQEKIKVLREKWGLVGGVVFEVGVGICTGTVAEGIVGSDSKKQLISMGDTTNTAARIQALSKKLDSLVTISESTYHIAGRDINADVLDEMELKGKKRKVTLYRVNSIKPEGLARLNLKARESTTGATHTCEE